MTFPVGICYTWNSSAIKIKKENGENI